MEEGKTTLVARVLASAFLFHSNESSHFCCLCICVLVIIFCFLCLTKYVKVKKGVNYTFLVIPIFHFLLVTRVLLSFVYFFQVYQ